MPAVAVGMIVIANLTRVLIVRLPHNDASIWCNTFARLDPVSGGILLAVWLHGRNHYSALWARLGVGLSAVALLLLVGNYGDHTDWRALYSYPVAALACVLLLWSIMFPQGTWNPGWVGRGFIYLGRISYGLYIFHLLVFECVRNLGHQAPVLVMSETMAIAVCMAALSYHFLETPFLRLKKQFTFVGSRDYNVIEVRS